jgi:hypothetical protein
VGSFYGWVTVDTYIPITHIIGKNDHKVKRLWRFLALPPNVAAPADDNEKHCQAMIIISKYYISFFQFWLFWLENTKKNEWFVPLPINQIIL